MSESVIKIEGVGKKYIISHEKGRGYTALRDIISDKAKGLIKKKNDLPPKEEFWALKDVSFEIKQGEVLGIIGKNGAGKSTLLKILSRITEPTTGRIEVNGRVASLLEVGTGFHPELSGRENIFLNGAILGMTRAEIRKKFDEIVDFSGVENFLDTPVKRYSSGMYVRLAFGVAAHLEPEVLIIDEVLAVGDAEFQKRCLGKMEEVSRKEGRTVLFVSHNLPSIKQLCTKGILLMNGRVEYQGTSEATVQRYLDLGEADEKVTQKKYTGDEKPGGEVAELLEYALKNLAGENITTFNLYEEVKIEMVFRVMKDGPRLYPNLHFFNQQDQYLFVSSADDSQIVSGKGVYKTTFILKPYIFNTGVFKVGIAVTSYPGFDVQFFVNPAMTFEVEETNLYLRANPYRGMMPGDLRLKLENETINI